MSIRNKLVITFFVYSLVLTFAMAALMRMNFQQGLDRFITEKQQQLLQNIAPVAEAYYQEKGNWLELEQHPRQLRQLLAQSNDSESIQFSKRPPPHRRDVASRVYLLDKNRKPIAGRYKPSSKNRELSLKQGESTIGYLGLKPRKKRLNHEEERFQQQQGRGLIYIVLTCLAFSLLFAWPLASLLLRRLNQLANFVRGLSLGNYEDKVAIKSNDELTDLGNHLNHLAQSLEQSEQSRRKLVADVSHELRTPLSTLRAQLESIEDGVHQYNATTHQRLKQQVERLSKLIDDLYTLSLSDIGALQYHKQPIHVRETVNAVTQPYEEQFKRKGIELSVDNRLQTEDILFADKQRLTQLFANLLQNSLQYTDAPGACKIQTSIQHKDFIFEIEDSAPGVPEDQQPHLIERLYRGDASRNRSLGGAGLGLSLCHNIVLAHNGSLEFESSPTGGLKVTVRLPLHQPSEYSEYD
jgi:two-component system sensor histidine kinase BaeS